MPLRGFGEDDRDVDLRDPARVGQAPTSFSVATQPRSRATSARSNAVRTSGATGESSGPRSRPSRKPLERVSGTGVAGCPAREHGPEQRGVRDAARQRADMIQRRAERHHAGGRHFANRRLQADDAAAGGRDPDRSAGVRTDRRQPHAGGDRHGGPAARSPGRPGQVRRMFRRHRTRSLRWSCRARTRAGWSCRETPRRPARSRSVSSASAVATRSASTRDAAVVAAAGDVDQILQRDRHAVERPAHASRRALAIERGRVAARAVGVDGDERVRGRLVPRDRGRGSRRPVARTSSVARSRSASALVSVVDAVSSVTVCPFSLP